MGDRSGTIYRTGNVLWVRFRAVRGPRARRRRRGSYKMPSSALWVVLLTALTVSPTAAVRGAPGRPIHQVVWVGVKNLGKTQERGQLNVCSKPGFPAGNSLRRHAAPST